MLSTDHVVVVTGGGGGIGSAVARAYAAAGAAVVVNDYGVTVDGRDPGEGPAHKVAEEITAAGGRAVAHTSSVASYEAAGELIELAIAEFGHVDSLVTAHGILRERMVFNLTEQDWDEVVNVHLKGTFTCVRHASAHMRARRTGSILTVTSTAGIEGNPAQANYAAAKAGIIGLARSTALAMGKYDVNVNALAPAAATRMTDRLTARSAATKKASDRGDASLCGALAVALSAPRMRHVTGQVFTAAGRRLARWSQPYEQVTAHRDRPWTAEEVAGSIEDELGVAQLRRFGALGLALPGDPARHAASGAPSGDARTGGGQ